MKYVRYEVIANGCRYGIFQFFGSYVYSGTSKTHKMYRKLSSAVPVPPGELFHYHGYKTLSYFKQQGNEKFAIQIEKLFKQIVEEFKLPETTKLKIFNKIKIGEIIFEDDVQILTKKVEKPIYK